MFIFLNLTLHSFGPEDFVPLVQIKLKIALFGELSLEEAIDLSRDRQIID
jgi:hypothetical protein